MFDIEQTKAFQAIFDAPYWFQTYLGNTLAEYVTALVAFLVILLILKIVQWSLLRYLGKLSKRTDTTIDDVLIRIVKTIRPPFYSFISVYLAVRFFLDLEPVVGQIFDGLLIIWVVYQVVFVAQVLIDYLVRTYLMRGENDAGEESMVNILGVLTKIVLWAIGILAILANLGFDILPIIAGLGVLGLGIGLALQPVFTDLFAAFTIFFDKPFRVGDFIIFGDQMGTVEKIGVISTRLRALSGEEIVMPNSDLTSATIHNINELARRRVAFHFGVTRETGIEKLRDIPNLTKKAIENIEKVDFDRAHFKQFDNSALTYEIVYYINSGDYAEYMGIQEEINLNLCESFAKEKIDMAYPTQVVYQYNITGTASGESQETK